MTAVSRVDFLLQTPMVKGEMNKATAVESAPSQPAKRFMTKINFWITDSFNSRLSHAMSSEKKFAACFQLLLIRLKPFKVFWFEGSRWAARGTVKLLFLNSFNYVSWMFERRKEFLFIFAIIWFGWLKTILYKPRNFWKWQNVVMKIFEAFGKRISIIQNENNEVFQEG